MDNKKNKPIQKKKYEAPKIKTEALVAYGASCNGNAVGGRKETTGPGSPGGCRSNRLLS